jgi:hypothetical protein
MGKKENQCELWLDSGAFSAWRKREPIRIKEYIRFCHKYPTTFKYIVNLDVMPATFGVRPNTADVEHSAEASMKNLLRMRKEGIEAMPVYHIGERRYWLEKMIGEGFTYIGLSPGQLRTNAEKAQWLNMCFHYLCGARGFPSVKTHAFGATAGELLFQFPWYSADSISWMLMPAVAKIYIPPLRRDGAYDYSVPPTVIVVSKVDGGRTRSETTNKMHIDNLGLNLRKYCEDYLNSLGHTLHEMVDSYFNRMIMMARFHAEMAKQIEQKAFRHRTMGFFDSAGGCLEGAYRNQFGPLRLVLTLNASSYVSRALQEARYNDRLISYWYFRPGRDVLGLDQYLQTGKMPPSKMKMRKRTKNMPKWNKFTSRQVLAFEEETRK